MHKKKGNLNEYNMMVYPMLLWVSDSVRIIRDFVIHDSEGLREAYETSTAITCHAIRKSDGKKGVLVLLNIDVKCDDILNIVNTLAHEAVHVTDVVYEDLGMYSQNFSEGNEPYAYLTGFVTEKLYESAMKPKIKNYDSRGKQAVVGDGDAQHRYKQAETTDEETL